MNESRRLTEKEIQQIFRRAAELQEKRGTDLAEWGPTTADVMKLGEELGMDATTLRAAIDEVLAGKVNRKAGFWGEGLTFESDRTYQAELTDDEWHELLQQLRSKFGRTGSVAEAAGAREWDGSQGVLDPIHISARSKGGSTRVAIKSDLYGAAFILAIVSFFPLLIAVTVITKETTLPALLQWLISAGVFGVVVGAWRKLLGRMGLRRRRAIEETEQKIEELADRLASAPEAHTEDGDEIRLRT
ncbi:MAG: hypothetical protein M3R13_07075 [Armatimonadota bacterium]|nr:hypothetical protein [Armatimonadota bacterium]